MVALWRAAIEAHGGDLPAPVEQYQFAAPWRAWRADYAWPRARVIVELDGMAWQAGGGHHNTDEDRFRNNSAAALGWRMLHFTSKALRTDPAGCVALLRRALEKEI
jgi:very-short-patch-repair endonuclease